MHLILLIIGVTIFCGGSFAVGGWTWALATFLWLLGLALIHAWRKM
jgi:hypothetical protein